MRPVPRIKQRVAGEHPIAHQVAVGIVGVAGRVEHVERQALDRQLVALGQPHRDDIGLGLLAHHGDAVRAVAQRAEPGDMVGMQMRVDGLHQPQIEFVDELEIAVDLLQHRIDDQRLAAAPACEQVGVGRRKRCRKADGRSWRPPGGSAFCTQNSIHAAKCIRIVSSRTMPVRKVGHRRVVREACARYRASVGRR